MPKVPVRDLAVFSLWNTPGAAAVCQAIQTRPKTSYDDTNRGNSIAVARYATQLLMREGFMPSPPAN